MNPELIFLFIIPIYFAVVALVIWLIVRFVRVHERLSEAAMGIARIYERQYNQQQKLHKPHENP